MKEINIPVFHTFPGWEKCESYEVPHHLWAESYPQFYAADVKLCVVENQGLFVRLCCEESEPKAVYTKRDDPIYKDSCLEFFVQPVSGDARYINFEINPNGAYLSELGTSRFDRVLVKEVTDAACKVTVLCVENGWGIELFIPDMLVADCYNKEFSFSAEQQIKINIYKCGDETEYPHYSSLFFVDTPKPDFHRPEFFGTVKIIDERIC